MKIAIVFGKGLDGCGVEKYASEWQRYMPNDVDVYTLVERGFQRGGIHVKGAVEFKSSDIPAIGKKLNGEYDIVILNSYPSPLHSRETVRSFFYDLVMKIERPILVAMMHEIISNNFDRIPIHLAIANACDVVFNFSTDTNYMRAVSKILTNKKLGERLARFKSPINVRELEHYRLPFSAKARRCIYTGRWSSMKDPHRLVDLHALNSSIHFAIHGIERSIGAVYDIIKQSDYNIKFEGYRDERTELIEAYGPYNSAQGAKLIADSMFGYSGFHLPTAPHNYGDRMEYSQMEIFALGSVPVFDSHYGIHNIAEDGRRFNEHEKIAIWSDSNDLPGTIAQLEALANNESLYEEYREAGREFLYREADASVVIPQLINHIVSVGKQTDKWSLTKLFEICYGCDITPDFEELFAIHIPAFGVKEVNNSVLSYFEKKARIEWRKITPPVDTLDCFF